MQENIEYVQRGFRILLTAMSGFLWQRMRRIYKDKWWDEVMRTLGDPRDLPWTGEDTELVDSLDVANCLRLIDRKCSDDLRDTLNLSCRAYARELMGVRNITAFWLWRCRCFRGLLSCSADRAEFGVVAELGSTICTVFHGL